MKRALQSEPTLFTHVRVVTPERIRDGMAVLTKDGSIQGLYPEEETPAFEGRVIDGGAGIWPPASSTSTVTAAAGMISWTPRLRPSSGRAKPMPGTAPPPCCPPHWRGTTGI